MADVAFRVEMGLFFYSHTLHAEQKTFKLSPLQRF